MARANTTNGRMTVIVMRNFVAGMKIATTMLYRLFTMTRVMNGREKNMMVSIEYFDFINAMDKMCDDFCFFRTITTDPEVLEKHCEECPMNKLVKLNDEDDEE